ncbi:MAG TPA: hypothetical protein VGO90_05880 [Chthoniobacteraceae bacterium]|jgi:hypothetical protein|nr:hypothetical protein [Chthoniobacteraceae bacterium]
MSLAEIQKAVDELQPEELTKLAGYIAQRENARWDDQIDADFDREGRLRAVLEEVRGDIQAGRLNEMP